MKRIPSTAHLRLFSSSLRLSLALGAAGVFATVGSAAGKDTAGSKDTYYLNDHLATTVATSDAAGEIAQIEADAFGTQEGPVAKDSRFTGKPYDADMGAYVFPFRNYRSDEARWMSADPSGFPDGVNASVYAQNPLLSFDNLGLYTVIVNPSQITWPGQQSTFTIANGQNTASVGVTGFFTIQYIYGGGNGSAYGSSGGSAATFYYAGALSILDSSNNEVGSGTPVGGYFTLSSSMANHTVVADRIEVSWSGVNLGVGSYTMRLSVYEGVTDTTTKNDGLFTVRRE